LIQYFIKGKIREAAMKISTNQGNDELAELRDIVATFRERWRTKIERVALKTITVDPSRGTARSIYLLPDTEPELKRFERASDRMRKRIDALSVYLGKRKSRGLWMPTLVRECQAVRRRAYQATSAREVSREQADTFVRRHGAKLPKGEWRYFVRSATGFRYKLLVRVDGRLRERAVTEWSVIGCLKPIKTGKKPEPLVRGTPRLTDEAWAARGGLQLLCTTGKSNLYAQPVKASR
jgi:hypothetical protein